MDYNYKLIYEVRKLGFNTNSLSNIQVGLRNEAYKKALDTHEQYMSFLRKKIGHANFEVTNVACLADGIAGHVYAADDPHEPRRGLGKRHCVFCGCDDFND